MCISFILGYMLPKESEEVADKITRKTMPVRPAESKEDVRKCFAVMKQLRPHLGEEAFVNQVRRQMEGHGYSLVYIEENGEVKAAAGYRVAEFLAWGKILYVDDLITGEADRGKGFGGTLMQWLHERAKESGCSELHLDSGVHRFGAHRLYIKGGMDISSHHFSKKLG